MNIRLLTLALALALLPAGVQAKDEPSEISAAERRELREAQQALGDASRRVAELSQKLYREEIRTALLRPAFERPIIGVVMAVDEGAGVRLAAVTPKSPAAKAGLRGGDRLLRIDGKALAAAEEEARLVQAREFIGELEEGEQVRIAYERDGKTREVTLAAESMPGLVWWRGEGETPEAIRTQLQPLLAGGFDMELGNLTPLAGCGRDGNDCMLAPLAEAFRWRGLHLAALEPKLGRYFGSERGVLVLTTPDDDLEGLEPGDVILSIDGQRVDKPQQAMRLMRSKAPGDRIGVQFLRDRKTRELALDAPKLARFPLLPPPPAPPAPPAPPTPAAAPAPMAPPAPGVPATMPAPGVPARMPAPRARAAPAVAPHPPHAPPPPAPPPPDERVGVLQSVLL